MRNKIFSVFGKFIVLLILMIINLPALEIPLATLTIEKETTIMAYVDMDRILRFCQQSPKVQQEITDLRATYEKEEKELEEKITSGEKEIASLSEETAVLSSSSPALTEAATNVLKLPGVSEDQTREIENKQKELADKKNELENLRQELARKRTEHQTEINKRESQICDEKTVQIYEVLKKIAAEEGIAIIVNKGNILYGPAHRDLTEKVIQILEQQ